MEIKAFEVVQKVMVMRSRCRGTGLRWENVSLGKRTPRIRKVSKGMKYVAHGVIEIIKTLRNREHGKSYIVF